MWALAATGDSSMSTPQILMAPALGARLPVSICMVVVLPAPLGPRKPSTSPCLSCKSTLSTAMWLPKCRDRPLALIVATAGAVGDSSMVGINNNSRGKCAVGACRECEIYLNCET